MVCRLSFLVFRRSRRCFKEPEADSEPDGGRQIADAAVAAVSKSLRRCKRVLASTPTVEAAVAAVSKSLRRSMPCSMAWPPPWPQSPLFQRA